MKKQLLQRLKQQLLEQCPPADPAEVKAGSLTPTLMSLSRIADPEDKDLESDLSNPLEEPTDSDVSK